MSNHLEALNTNHNLSNFDCGSPALNQWLQTIASQHHNKMLSRTFVVTSGATPDVLGYYALALRGLVASTTLPPQLAKRLPLNIPAITLARLAVSLDAQGQRIGEELLVDALRRAKQTALQVGGAFIFVDAKDATAAAFYDHYGFVALPDNPLVLCMKILDIPD